MQDNHINEVFKDGVWAHALIAGGSSLIFKVTKEDLSKAVQGHSFTAYHPLLIRPNSAPQYLPGITETEDPWFMNGALFLAVAVITKDGQAELEQLAMRVLNPQPPSQIVTADPLQTPEGRRAMMKLVTP